MKIQARVLRRELLRQAGRSYRAELIRLVQGGCDGMGEHHPDVQRYAYLHRQLRLLGKRYQALQ